MRKVNMLSLLKGDPRVLTPRLGERRMKSFVLRHELRRLRVVLVASGDPGGQNGTLQVLEHEDVRTCTTIHLAVSKVAHVFLLRTHMQQPGTRKLAGRKQERTNHRTQGKLCV